MAYQLILDTSSHELAVGIADGTKVIVKIQYSAWQKQSEYTMVEVDKALQMAKIKPQDLDRIIVASGPGSYTGVRIALTIAKVMASLLHIKVCAISSLAAIAGISGYTIALMDARSSRAYVGLYHQGIALTKDQIMALDDIVKLIQEKKEFQLAGDVMLLQQAPQPIDYIENLYALSKLYPDVEVVDLLTPCYLKD